MSQHFHSHKVNIGGENFQIRSDQPPQVIEKIAGYLDFKIREMSSGSLSGDKFRMTVLAAMNIAGELFDLKAKLEENDKRSVSIEEKAKVLCDSLDKALSSNRV